MSQADVIRYLGRRRMEVARAQGWLKPRSVIHGKRGRALETFAFADVVAAENRFLEPK